MSGMLFGQAISPTIGGYLATQFDWRAAFIFLALTPLISFPLNLITMAKTPSVQDAESSERISDRRSQLVSKQSPKSDVAETDWAALVAVYLGNFVNFFNRHGMRSSLLPLYAGMVLGMDSASIGAILTIGSVFTIIINIPSGIAADKVGKKVLLLPGLLTLCVGNALLLSGNERLLFIVSTVFISMGVLSNSMLSGLVADLVPDHLVGKGMGVYRFTADLGVVTGPFVLGLVMDSYGFDSALIAGMAVVLTGVVSAIVFIPRDTSRAPVGPAA